MTESSHPPDSLCYIRALSINSDSRNYLTAEQLRGVLLPLTTPFTSDTAEIDFDALRFNLHRWLQTSISGVVLLGSTGERVHVDQREYLELINRSREIVPRDRLFIVGAGQQSTHGSIKEIQRAADAGADAVLVITPSFYRSAMTQSALLTHYGAIADAARVPVILYSMPDLTGIKIQPETIAELSNHPNIIGVKDSSNDIPGFRETIRLVRESAETPFAIMSGNGTVFLDTLRAGANAGILAVGCVVPELCLNIYRAFHHGDEERAVALDEKSKPLARAVTSKYGIGGLKAALDMAGYRGGPARAPLRSPGENALVEIRELLNEADSAMRGVVHAA